MPFAIKPAYNGKQRAGVTLETDFVVFEFPETVHLSTRHGLVRIIMLRQFNQTQLWHQCMTDNVAPGIHHPARLRQ